MALSTSALDLLPYPACFVYNTATLHEMIDDVSRGSYFGTGDVVLAEIFNVNDGDISWRNNLHDLLVALPNSTHNGTCIFLEI